MPSPFFSLVTEPAMARQPLRGSGPASPARPCAGAWSPRTSAPRNWLDTAPPAGGGARPSWRGPACLCAGALTHAAAADAARRRGPGAARAGPVSPPAASMRRVHAHTGPLLAGRRSAIVRADVHLLDAMLFVEQLPAREWRGARGMAWTSAVMHCGRARDELVTRSPALLANRQHAVRGGSSGTGQAHGAYRPALDPALRERAGGWMAARRRSVPRRSGAAICIGDLPQGGRDGHGKPSLPRSV